MMLRPLAAACNLINNEMKQFVISSETDAIREVEDRVLALLATMFCSQFLVFLTVIITLFCNFFRVTKWRLHGLSKKK